MKKIYKIRNYKELLYFKTLYKGYDDILYKKILSDIELYLRINKFIHNTLYFIINEKDKNSFYHYNSNLNINEICDMFNINTVKLISIKNLIIKKKLKIIQDDKT